MVEACSLVRPSSQALLGTGVAAPHPARPGRTGVSLSKRPRAGRPGVDPLSRWSVEPEPRPGLFSSRPGSGLWKVPALNRRETGAKGGMF